MLAIVLLLAAQPVVPGCDLASVKTMRTVHEALGRKAVELVSTASARDKGADGRLARLVYPSASFSLGGGDVGQPLGQGATGARALADAVKADQYRFLGWDYMDGFADGCGKQSVEVEFVNAGDRLVSKVSFSFEGGRVTGASGWRRTFESGVVPVSLSSGSH